MTRIVRCLAVFLSVLFVLVSNANAFDNDDFQARFADSVSWRIHQDWQAYLYQEYNFGDDAGNFHCQVQEPGFVYSGFAPWFDLVGAFVKVFAKNGGEWREENIPYAAGVFKKSVAGWDISSKNRFEFVQKEKADDDWYYRNFIVAAFPVRLTSLQIRPYVADEFSYDFDENFLAWNEFRMGVNFPAARNIGCGVYYLLRHSHVRDGESDAWKRSAHILAAELNFSF